jgi:5-methylcytosine-specific restriction endonuclease McrA
VEVARRAGVDEPRRALAADALVGLVGTSGDRSDPDPAGARGASDADTAPHRPPGPSAVVHVRVDHAALMRGHAVGDELCEIPGIGPIPVEVARRLAVDSLLHVLVTDGVDVKTVTRAGRTIPAALRRALEERDPVCVVPGCDTRDRLEIDHLVPFADGGRTSLSNLARLCHWHHYLKTHHGHRLERVAHGDASAPPDGGWHWITPDDPPVVPRRIRRSG